ncbi:Nucleolar protein 13 [Yarrowia sp. C11]|nr:Nucleolar protein 13 [Yarrowia sp. E02]KAG5369641.1 Nucleolar protein 13 [Yarrowia sp. C11]
MSDSEVSTKRKIKEEIEIDLDKSAPLSKKQKRLEKKGKLPVEKADDEEEAKSKKSEHGVWIGNLSFDTCKDDIKRFILAKLGKNEDDPDAVVIEEDDLLRINLPKSKATKKVKGFAYVDVPTAEKMERLVTLSEQILNGRKLLIKNANSFEGRPEKKDPTDTESRVLFVGNLPFSATEEMLKEHFMSCGDIRRVRMMSFEDTGKSKGFSFVDFYDADATRKALKGRMYKYLEGRTLRLEAGEDRSKRVPKPRKVEGAATEEGQSAQKEYSEPAPVEDKPAYSEDKESYDKPKRSKEDRPYSRKKPGQILASAQRASVGIVKSTGKKMTFD